VPLPQLNVERLRFFLNGESSVVHDIYELLSWNVSRVVVAGKANHTLGPGCLRPVGFDADEAILDYSQRSFPGYRLLQEYFAFPEKFLFYDLCGLAGAWAKAGTEDRADIYLLVDAAPATFQQQRLERGINKTVFRLNCVPIVNLFEQTCEPISLNHRTFEYPVIPDVRRPMATEVHSIQEVVIGDARSSDFRVCEPFYSPKLHSRSPSGKSAYWTLYRRPSGRPDDAGTDVLLSIVNSEQKSAVIEDGTVTVRAICTNRDLPSRLPFGNAAGDFELDASAPVARIVALKKPTATLRSPGGPGSLWNLISHLSLNYLSLVGKEGAGALRALLGLCDFERSASSRSVVAGIAEIRSAPHYAPLQAPHGLSFVRGTRIELDFDEEKFVGRGVWLFASILERFFAQYCSLNSFTQFSARVLQGKEVVREWKPRSGHRLLV
jgi:type VI secretion system protein ImpG